MKGCVSIPAEKNFDGSIFIDWDGLQQSSSEFDWNGRGGQGKRIGDHLGHQYGNARAEPAGHSARRFERSRGSGKVGEDYFEIELAAAIGASGIQRGKFCANQILCHQLQARSGGLKAV